MENPKCDSLIYPKPLQIRSDTVKLGRRKFVPKSQIFLKYCRYPVRRPSQYDVLLIMNATKVT